MLGLGEVCWGWRGLLGLQGLVLGLESLLGPRRVCWAWEACRPAHNQISR